MFNLLFPPKTTKIKFVKKKLLPHSLGLALIHLKGSCGYRKLSIYLLVIKGLGVVYISKPMTDSNFIIPGIDNSNYLTIVFASSILLSVKLLKVS